jgi:hypothetical protein
VKLTGVVSLARSAYVLASEIWDEVRRERAGAKASRAAKEAAMTKVVAHQRTQEKAAISHKVTPTPTSASVSQLRPRAPPR